MITQQQAEQLVCEYINRRDPSWPDRPDMSIVRVEAHELGWLIFYDSKPHQETGDVQHAIAGNAPYLVSREDGSMFVTGTAPPFEDRLREAEHELRKHLKQ